VAIYDLSYIGTDTNRVYFNDYTGQYQSSNIVFRVKSKAPQQRDIRDLDIPIPFENGISDFETLEGKVVYVLDGTMYPNGESSSDDGLAMLRKVSSLEVNQADALSDAGYIPYYWTEFARTKMLFVKPLYVQMVETTRQGLVQDFRIISKIKDPTIFSSDLQVASSQQAAFGPATGTAIYSFSYPIIYGASTSSVSTDAVNNGDIAVYPTTIQIFGPVNSPKITNSTTGEYIQVNANLATNSNVLTITYDKDTFVVEVDGVSNIQNVTSDSTFFKLQPGGNQLTLTGSSISDTAYFSMSYRSGWPLS